ncbi:RHS repeat-associated protein [Acinetobacter calcoaceticus]|uniref:RHS repeat-associated protein n=1 Tax=Acinetobacter calcoaceticus TaxID=471 RepID=A0A4R1X9X0_ACICA|nr:RHS repeat-associated protein [Acinetobacter calcoaceticus]
MNYQYDPVGRLIKTQSAHLKESFSFDPAGNLIDPTSTQDRVVKNNLIKRYQGADYRYDAQGNMIEKTHAGHNLKLHWDNLNRLASREQNGKTTQYGYDVFGRRLFKQTTNQGLTVFGWDGDLMIWESLQSSDETQSYTKHYVYEPNSFVPLVQAGYQGFIKLIDTPDYSQPSDQPYSMRTDPVWKTDTRSKRAELQRVAFYHCDQVGTPQALSNEKGELVWDASLNTWGQALEIKTSDNVLEQTNIRFQGQYYDRETGLHYNRYRYYEPHSARYVGKDPIGLEGGLNNSSYVPNSNQWIDPMGLQEKKTENWKQALNPTFVGQKSADNMLNRSDTVRMADRFLTGMNANVSFAMGLGLTHTSSYSGGGKTTHSTGRQLGLGGMISTTRDIFTLGKARPDGRYLEGCLSAGALISGQLCVGWSWTADTKDHWYTPLYLVGKAGTGLGMSADLTDGSQTTVDHLKQDQPTYVIPPEKMPTIPKFPFNAPGY